VDRLILDFATVGLMLVVGLMVGLANRKQFDWRWLLVAASLLVLNNLLQANLYRFAPDLLGGTYNWQGKLLASAGTLAIASLAAFGWRRCYITLTQQSGSLRVVLPVMLVYCLYPIAIALVFPSDPPTVEDIGFQLTLPGIEEELFFRGVLLFALDQALRGRVRFLGVDWGWGAILSSLAFGLGHALDFGGGSFSFDPLTMALTTLPSFVGIWVVYKTRSLLLPVLLHNFGNSIGLFL
jgi:uncharacterized protein